MPEKRRRSRIGHLGLGVDAEGGPVIDPTENVIALTDAANKRQDDLRDLNNKLLEAESRHLREMATLRDGHNKEIRAAETDRLNSIRKVDVDAVTTAAERSMAAIQTLAATTEANARNISSALTSTAQTIAQQLAATVNTINDRLQQLERSSYEGKGKEAVADPMLAELVREIKSLSVSRAEGLGQRDGISDSAKVMVGAIMLLIAVLGFFGLTMRQAQPGQLIYTPSPPGTMLPSAPPQAVPR